MMRWEVRLIQQAMARLPTMRGNVDFLVSQKMREMDERFWELLTETGRRRLARTIMRLAETIGIKEPEGILIPISTDELAKMTGMTMFTASRYIAAWRDTGFILGRRREALVVRDADELLAKCVDTYAEP